MPSSKHEPVYILDAMRTPVVPRNGAFKQLGVEQLAVPVIQTLLRRHGLSAGQIQQVVMGNALYGGGNPARLIALAAGVPETVPAVTIDTQCCSGMDAIALAAEKIQLGKADIVLAGGVESFSRSAIRLHRPVDGGEAVEYARPPFTPWSDRDPDMTFSAAQVAQDFKIDRQQQHEWVINSHKKALGAKPALSEECVEIAGVTVDAATRVMSEKLCQRSPIIAGEGDMAIDVASTALEADAAAWLILVSERWARQHHKTVDVVWQDCLSVGTWADKPPLAAAVACEQLLHSHKLDVNNLAVIELMEAFAVQSVVNAQALDLPLERINLSGGALARGHPIGASGAILLVRLWHELLRQPPESIGLAGIAAAGGLGSATLLRRE
ncbi:MAG: thiolase family protein [Arenicella sp.]